MLRPVIASINRNEWFGGLGLTVMSAVAGVFLVPPSDAHIWERLAYGVASGAIAFVVLLIAVVGLRIVTSPLRHLWNWRQEVRLGQRCVEVAREITLLFPWEEKTGIKIKEHRKQVWEINPYKPLTDEQRAAINQMLLDPASYHHPLVTYNTTGIAARAFRVTTEVSARGYITDKQRDEMRERASNGLEMMVIAKELVVIGINLGGKA